MKKQGFKLEVGESKARSSRPVSAENRVSCRKQRGLPLRFCVSAMILLLALGALAQYSIDWQTIDGGGGTSTGGVIGGGVNNQAGQNGTVAGGALNRALGNGAFVGGGGSADANGSARGNYATGDYSAIAGGLLNDADGYFGMVLGGYNNDALGEYSFASGRNAKANHDGAFVWADSQNRDFASTAANQFNVRSTGGVRLVTAINASTGAATAGASLSAGGTSWGVISDRAVKKNFGAIDTIGVLEKLAEVPVQSWNYQWENDSDPLHIGPMAQDFKAAFYPGREDKNITTLEFDGVALAAIQGLNEKLTEELNHRDTEITELKSRLEKLEKLLNKRVNGGAL